MNELSNASSGFEFSISSEGDIVTARRIVRNAALQLGFRQTDVARIVTAASELAPNIFRYAGSGVMRLRKVEDANRVAMELQFIDSGPQTVLDSHLGSILADPGHIEQIVMNL